VVEQELDDLEPVVAGDRVMDGTPTAVSLPIDVDAPLEQPLCALVIVPIVLADQHEDQMIVVELPGLDDELERAVVVRLGRNGIRPLRRSDRRPARATSASAPDGERLRRHRTARSRARDASPSTRSRSSGRLRRRGGRWPRGGNRPCVCCRGGDTSRDTGIRAHSRRREVQSRWRCPGRARGSGGRRCRRRGRLPYGCCRRRSRDPQRAILRPGPASRARSRLR